MALTKGYTGDLQEWMLWKPSEKMSSSPGFAGRMVHLALQKRKTLLKIDKLLLVSYVLPSTLMPALTVLQGRKITTHFTYVCVIWGTGAPLNIKYMYTKCKIILFLCFVLTPDR